MASQTPSDIRTIVGSNIKLARAGERLTQGDLARLLGVDSFQVSRWERGLHRPSDETLLAIAEAVSRDLAWFFTDPSAKAA